jgi:hypothetical protein
MPIQLRRKAPRQGVRDPYYSPERDIAYIGMPLVRAAMAALDEQWMEPWFKEFMAQYNLTEDDLGQAAPRFARALEQIIEAENPVVALENVGFHALDPPVQTAFYTKIGQVFLAAIWTGVKDVNSPDSPNPLEVDEIVHSAEQILDHFHQLRLEHQNAKLGPQAPGKGKDAQN